MPSSIRMPKKVAASDEPCCLRLSVNIGPHCGEPSDYVLQYEGDVLAGDDFLDSVGSMTLYVADLYGAVNNGVDPFDVLDSVDSGLAHFCALITSGSRRFKPTIARLAGDDVTRVLILGHLTLQKSHRGRGIGLSAIEVACSRLGGDCPLAVLKAYPTQWEGKDGDETDAFRRDQAKLVNYYRRASFAPVIGRGLMARRLFDEMR